MLPGIADVVPQCQKDAEDDHDQPDAGLDRGNRRKQACGLGARECRVEDCVTGRSHGFSLRDAQLMVDG